jgi:hypothetical protein
MKPLPIREAKLSKSYAPAEMNYKGFKFLLVNRGVRRSQ